MGRLVEKVNALREHVKNILSHNRLLKDQNRALKEARVKDNQEIEQLKAEIARCHKRVEQLETANALLGSKEYKTKTKLKINSLINELDACIIQLAD